MRTLPYLSAFFLPSSPSAYSVSLALLKHPHFLVSIPSPLPSSSEPAHHTVPSRAVSLALPGLTFRAGMFSNSIWPNILISQKERIMPREVRCPGSHSWECRCRLTHCPMWLLQGLYNIWYELFHLTLQGKCGDVHGGWSGMQGVTQYGWLFSFKER